MTVWDRLLFGIAGLFFGIGVLIIGHAFVMRGGGADDKASPSLAALPAPPTPVPDKALYAVLYDRPVFVPSRHMAPPAPVAVAQTSTTPALLSLSLDGVMIGVGKKIALVKRAGGKEVLSVAEGDTIDGWVVQEVQTHAIILSAGGMQQLIHLPEKED